MKMVEFTRDMRPHRVGDKRVVPDAVAQKLIAAGDAKHFVSVFDKAPAQPGDMQSHSDTKSSAKPSVGKTYKTRKRGQSCQYASSQLL
ncbi:MAG: hypothetical protein KGJ21_10015 [Pseudomonadota bacterium]|nr:hypothetical protein [Pseudomonadota bacterium]